MTGYGTYDLPPGTWSDDSSLTFCLADSLTNGFDLTDISNRFVQWYRKAYWSADGDVFDIGIATRKALQNIEAGVSPALAGGVDEMSNGNGSLMRILPLAFYTVEMDRKDRFEIVRQVSSITHRHPRSIFACIYFVEMAVRILRGMRVEDAYVETNGSLKSMVERESLLDPNELIHFSGIFSGDLGKRGEETISSSGYVIHTLEAAIWCLLHSKSFEESVLKAVNLGEDSDTTGAVVGGLAGIVYGEDQIPQHWLKQLARVEDIRDLSSRLAQSIGK
jgi:ADP-ribosylglycohydrolase